LPKSIVQTNFAKNLPMEELPSSPTRLKYLPSARSLVVWAIKNRQKIYPKNDTDTAGIDHVVRIFKAYELVTTRATVRASWAKAGFEYCKRDDRYYLLVNDEKIREMSEFSEVWCINFPIEGLSARRRAQKWGFVNVPFSKGDT
jgi:hypothetical protein